MLLTLWKKPMTQYTIEFVIFRSFYLVCMSKTIKFTILIAEMIHYAVQTAPQTTTLRTSILLAKAIFNKSQKRDKGIYSFWSTGPPPPKL